MAKVRKRQGVPLLITLIFLLILLNYPFLNKYVDSLLEDSTTVHVNRVIDGDTLEAKTDNGLESVRLIGINTPERGEHLYNEAKAYLTKRTLNQSVKLEFLGAKEDKYGRTLAYVFRQGENINIEMVENGFANYYFYSGRDKYSDDLQLAWVRCMSKNINLCERSKNVCSECVVVDKSSIVNKCTQSCDIGNWTIKGEGREVFTFNQKTLGSGQAARFQINLENTGGSLFLRDSEGKLVDWKA